MSTTVRLIPSTYDIHTEGSPTYSNLNNSLANTSSSTYATVLCHAWEEEGLWIDYTGFDFSQIPSGATNISVACKIKMKSSKESDSSNYYCRAYIAELLDDEPLSNYIYSTTAETVQQFNLNITANQLISMGNNFVVVVEVDNFSILDFTAYIYGVEVEVTYTAPQASRNKVIYNGNTLIDLTGDNVTAADVLSGVLFHLPSGEQGIGTLVPPSGGLEYESGTWSPSSDVTSGSIYFSNTHTESPSIVFVSVDAMRVASNYSFTRWCAIDYSRFMGFSDDYEGSGLISCIAQRSSTNAYAYGRVYLTYGGDTNGASNQTDISYKSYVKPDRIIPHLNSSYMSSSASYYWRSAKVYNWVAIWASNICE